MTQLESSRFGRSVCSQSADSSLLTRAEESGERNRKTKRPPSAGRRSELAPYCLTYEDEQDPDRHLQEEGGANQRDDEGVEGGAGALLQHGLQLGGVGHQQGHVQHALSRALLVGVVVQIQRGPAAGPGIWMGGL